MDLITGGITGSEVQTGYGGPFVGAPAVLAVDSDNAVDQYQLVLVDVSGFTETITSVTLGGEACDIAENDPTDDLIQVRMPGNLATGTYSLIVSGATETATISGISYTKTHPYTSPVGAVDSNSLFSSPVLITAGTYHRIVSGPSNGTLDVATAEAQGLWANDVADIYTPDAGFTGDDVVVIEVLFDDGTTDTINATITVESQVDTTPDPFTVPALTDQPLDQWVEFAPVTVSGIDAGEAITASVSGTDVEYAVDAGAGFGAFTTTPTPVQLGYVIKPRIRTAGAFETEKTGLLSIGSESSALSATTRAAVLPTLDVPVPDISVGQGDAVTIDLDDHFSGAIAYGVSGFPVDSGLSLVGSVLSGAPNQNDVAASPYTLTINAYTADGSVQDYAQVTVVDDVGPVVSVNPLTTVNTAPIVSGASGDAVTLTLVVSDGTTDATYNPAPVDGAWTQQLSPLAVGDYTMTLTGQDAAGNPATQATATLRIVSQTLDRRGLFRRLFSSQDNFHRQLFR